MSEGGLSVLTLNVCSPSLPRAERQLDWLDSRPEQIFVLTEIGVGAGSELLAERFRGSGWALRARRPSEGERGVMIASRVALGAETPVDTYLPERVAVGQVGPLEVFGVYAPSRDDSAERIARKRRFLAELLTLLGERDPRSSVLIGDLNVVERSGRGSERGFQEWEYELYEALPRVGWLDAYRALHPDRVEVSWTDTEGRGHRFDHCLITADLRPALRRCEYIHETREGELSDHSAMVVEFSAIAAESLTVDPTLAPGPASLF
jgi:exodeoxyribonuclease III